MVDFWYFSCCKRNVQRNREKARKEKRKKKVKVKYLRLRLREVNKEIGEENSFLIYRSVKNAKTLGM